MKSMHISVKTVPPSEKKIVNKQSTRIADFMSIGDDLDFIVSDLLSIVLKDPSIKLKYPA